MPDSVEDYRNLIEQPWGKMFYDMIFRQLDLSKDKRLKILDYGAGFCVTARYYAKSHNVTAYEPNPEMFEKRVEGDYKLITTQNDFKILEEHSFDVVICHNVLEYVSSPTEILNELIKYLKPNGILSIVKHNLKGRILAQAIYSDDPAGALNLFNSQADNGNNLFGKRGTYDNAMLVNFAENNGLKLENIFGIRTFFALSANSEIKYTEEWYKNMLELEMQTCDIEEYKNISFFHHLVFKSTGEH